MRSNASRVAMAAIFAATAASATAAEWFASSARPAGSGDGRSEATAFHTIQEAVDAASDGDVVTVLPGDYVDGGCADSEGRVTRVAIIGKSLTLRSVGGRDSTAIVGAHDPNGCHLGGDDAARIYADIGPDAVRCLFVSNAPATRIEGFTIRDGASHAVPYSTDVEGLGGGVLVFGAVKSVVVADCAIVNCAASRGGGMYGGTAVRCLFEYNRTRYGTGQAARETKLVNCMVRRNARDGDANVQLWGCRLANCTIAQNVAGAVFQDCSLVNCLAFLNGYGLGGNDNNAATNCLVSAGQDGAFAAGSLNLSATSDHQFIAPAAGDFRLIGGCAAVSLGSAEALAASVEGLDAADVYTDFAGRAIAKTGVIAAGCIQEAVSPASGAWLFSSRSVVDGYANETANNYVYATESPAFFRVAMDLDVGQLPFSFSNGDTGLRFPMTDGTVVLMAPPASEGVKSCAQQYATNFLYVAKDGIYSDGVRSVETPFRTIQAAIAAAPTLSRVSDDSIDQRTIIFVEQGEYTADDATEVDGVKYVAYAKLKRILVVGSGAETCVIRGAADSSVATDASPYGCGSGAVKCIGSANTAIACFRGFTIADGRGVAYDSGSDWGGAIAGGGKNYTFLCDCVVTNCVGNRGVVSSARMDRCLVVDCRDYYCTLRSAIAQNCVFEATESKYAPRDGFIGQDAEAYGCTFASRFNGQASFANSGAATIFNSIVSQGKNASVNHKTDGNVYWDMNSYAGTGYVQVDPAFVNNGSGDYRLLSLSGAIGNGSTTNAYWKFAGADVEGRMPLVANGRLTPGAVQKTVAAVVVARPSSGTLTNVGTNAVEAGESITVSYTAGSRPMAGIVVDGVTNSASAYSFTYTASADGNPVAAVSIQAAISPHWYVDPDGDDGNDGWTPETAKGTLKGVMTVSGLMSGDTVHAAAGSYTNKVMASPVGELAVRVVVPEGVALVADEGPESTFIVGEKDTSATAASGRDGCGTNAVRCVYLRNDSTLRGFTVCGGRVYGYNNNLIDDNIAGGILCQSFGSSVSSPVVYDCIISNNWGRCGAGSYGGRYVGCRFLENHGYSGEAASRYSSLYGCYLDRNYGAPTFGIYYALENCTFGPDNLTLAGDRSTGLYVCQQPLSSAIAKNCVFLDRVRRNDSNAVVATNSVFRSDDNSYSPIESQRLGCSLMTTNEMLFAAGWIPSRISPLTDAADETLMSDYAKKMDATGGRRTSNGLSDIGAFEHDWREDYATRLGGSQVRVDDASEDVVMDKAMTALKIGPGGTLSLTLLAGTTTVATRYTLPFEVLGEGSLEVTVNGLPAGVFATGEGSVEFKNALSANSVAFAYTANDGDDGVLLDTVSSRCNGMSIIVR